MRLYWCERSAIGVAVAATRYGEAALRMGVWIVAIDGAVWWA